jgi:hypothetical protein
MFERPSFHVSKANLLSRVLTVLLFHSDRDTFNFIYGFCYKSAVRMFDLGLLAAIARLSVTIFVIGSKELN